jgi:nucleoid-associated protein YgaU
MTLVKLLILVESGTTYVPLAVALFNPAQITITKRANWRLAPTAERDVPRSQFTHGDPATLTTDLFFDTYELGLDVRLLTAPISYLTTVEKHGSLHRPPICRLVWGIGIVFQGVLQSLTQQFTLFLATGTPVQATLSCSFREWRSDAEEALRLKKESVDVAKTRVVQRGDTLSAIAAVEYNNPALWRPIAEANGIDDPRHLTPGQVLIVPSLLPGQTRLG